MYTKGGLCNPNNPIIPEDLPNPNDIQYLLLIILGISLAGCAIALIFAIKN